MSRMLALRSVAPARVPDAVREQFLSLAQVHSDGWGSAGVDETGALLSASGRAASDLRTAAMSPRTTALHYLRLASSGSPVTPENLQPFDRGDVAFMHNGALVPYAAGLAALSTAERRDLRGTSDSELYASLVLRALTSGRGALRERIRRGVDAVRELYPAACLNAMLIAEGRLVVVASRGTVPAPVDALARRGVSLTADEVDAYNRLFRTRTDDGVQLVATKGIDVSGWEEIPDDEVVVL